jgi:RNA polymerase sigma factor (sigma-70 family)
MKNSRKDDSMRKRWLGRALCHLRQTAGGVSGDEPSDSHLLQRFVADQDEVAIETLVRRHGPMVLRVCQRILQQTAEAEDAFQATFIILVRKAGTIVRRESVGGWLYQVAYRTALKARSRSARRLVHERPVAEFPTEADRGWEADSDACRWDLRSVLDEELNRLPEKYRSPLVLCYLEGKTNQEAARQLGWSMGTVAGRLSRARDVLRSRLARRGLVVSGAAFGSLLAEQSAPAAVSSSLIAATVGSLHAPATGSAAALAEVTLGEMSRARLRLLAVVLVLVAAGAAVGLIPLWDTDASNATPSARGHEYPLPLAASYNTGQLPDGFAPTWQLDAIAAGHHLLPTFHWKGPEARFDDQMRRYYADTLRRARDQKLPICLYSEEWEASLYREDRYVKLPGSESPCWVSLTGEIRPTLSPFGSVAPWEDLGRRWTGSELLRELQAVYPDPPYVVFLSNNEARKLAWPEIDQEQRFINQFGRHRGDGLKAHVVGDGFAKRYRALLRGMRQGLGPWADRARFVAWGGDGIKLAGRSPEWSVDTLAVVDRPDIIPTVWDGWSPAAYLASGGHHWKSVPQRTLTDDTLDSPQVDAMNLVWVQEWARQQNPTFQWEVSVWDGGPEQRQKMTELGQAFPPQRYGGFVRWQLWLARASVIRDFRGWDEKIEAAGPWFREVIAAVNEVHGQPVLAEFWKSATLVANPARSHPYQDGWPAKWQGKERWFQLDCDADPPNPWGLDTPIPVWSLAFVLGEAPQRRWLVYVYSPPGSRSSVTVTVPGFGPALIDAPQAGAFFLLDEPSRAINLVTR